VWRIGHTSLDTLNRGCNRRPRGRLGPQPAAATAICLSEQRSAREDDPLRKASLLALTAATAALALDARAGGFYLQEQSARGTGRAYSGEVADQGVQSLWWNPAAIARSGREAYVGANGIFVDGKSEDDGSSITFPGGRTFPVGGQPRGFNPVLPGLAPNLAIVAPVGSAFAVGLSLATPFDFATKYRPEAWTRYDAQTSQLRTLDIQLTGAMRAADWLDLGVAVDAQHSDAHLSAAYPNLSPLLPDGASRLSGDGWNWGYTVGAQAHFDSLTLGASYRSKMDHDLDGRVVVSGLLPPLAAANLDIAGSASFTTPWIATLGGRYALTDRLTLNGQMQRFGWSEFDAIRVSTLAGPQVLVQNYHDTTSGGVGFDYAANKALTLRAGVQYDPTPTPDLGRTSRVPDGDRWLFGAGATGDLGNGLKLDAAILYIDFKSSSINHTTPFYAGTPAATTVQTLGAFEGTGYVISLGLSSRF
jgi:long-chain fatty acid transport protein